MTASSRRRLMVSVAATDKTFRIRQVDGKNALAGKCIHCRSAIVVPLDADVPASATIEHIVPKTHGGSNDPDNLALACSGCNGAKGVRLDSRHFSDPTLQKVIRTLQERREQRWREPIDVKIV